jgi:DNA-binding NtrC family response regulator
LIGVSRDVDPGGTASEIVGQSLAVVRIRDMVARLATTHAATILIEGESGTGKEVVAGAIHAQSARADKPFLCVNCAAVPEQLLESELFGHERGAFADAPVAKAGLFEAAAGGTVMLDEIGDLPPAGQAKLLRLLENRKFRRVGGVTELDTDVRVIAATNVDLERRVSDGLFRPDLFFRLNVVRLRLPALRDRKEDIPFLAAHFIARYNAEMKRSVRGVAPLAMEMMMEYRWPGNCRELRNVIERALILHRDLEEVRPEHLPGEIRAPPREPASAVVAMAGETGNVELKAMERRMILAAMHKCRGNRSQAARLLGISRYTLRYRLKKYALEHLAPDPDSGPTQ